MLLPEVRSADASDVIMADGFSCRTQIEQGDSGGRSAIHLAELLRAGLHGDDGAPTPERSWAQRPAPPSPLARGAVLGSAALAVAVGLGAVGGLVARSTRRH